MTPKGTLKGTLTGTLGGTLKGTLEGTLKRIPYRHPSKPHTLKGALKGTYFVGFCRGRGPTAVLSGDLLLSFTVGQPPASQKVLRFF